MNKMQQKGIIRAFEQSKTYASQINEYCGSTNRYIKNASNSLKSSTKVQGMDSVADIIDSISKDRGTSIKDLKNIADKAITELNKELNKE